MHDPFSETRSTAYISVKYNKPMKPIQDADQI